MSAPVLEVENVSVSFGGVRALRDVSFNIRRGAVHGLIGPNGAGKTTLLNVISRLVHCDSGSLRYEGTELLDLKPDMIARLGISRTFQNFGLIGSLSVLENVKAGLHSKHPGTIFDELFLIGRRNRLEAEAAREVDEILRHTGLESVADREAGGLSYGMRKSLELARALVARPKLLMLDEPTAGLNAREMDELKELVTATRRDREITILVITHHLEFLSDIADEVTVLDLGSVIAGGTPDEIRADQRVIQAYIGGEEPVENA